MTDEELARKLQAEWNDETQLDNDGLVAAKPEAPEARVDDGLDLPEKSICIPEAAPSEVATTSTPPVGKAKNTLSLQSVTTAKDSVIESLPLDESPLVFEPAKYIPQLQSHWAAEGGDASYALLTRCFVLVNGTQSRIKIVDTLVNCLRIMLEGDPSSLLPAVGTIPSPLPTWILVLI